MWTALGAVIVAVLALVGSVYTVRVGRKGQDQTNQIQRDAQVVQSYSELAEDWGNERRELRTELAELRARIEKLEERAARAEQRYGFAISYIRRLLSWIAQHLPEMQPPPVPATIAADLDQ